MKKNQLVLDVLKKVVSLMVLTSIFLPQLTLADSAATLKVITTVHNDHGGTLTPSDFTIIAYNNGALRYTFTGEGAGTDLAMDLGTYGVSGSLPPFYTVQLDNCAGAFNATTGPCNVTYRDVAHATTSPSVATLKVITNVTNNNGGLLKAPDFTATVYEDGEITGMPTGSNTGSIVNLTNGSAFSVTASSSALYTVTLSGVCSGTSIVGLGDCIISYDDIAPATTIPSTVTLNVITNITNDNLGTLSVSDFTATVYQGSDIAGFAIGSSTGFPVNLTNGLPFSVTASSSALYTVTVSETCSGTATVELADCVISYDDKAPVTPPAPKKITSSGSRAIGGRAFTPVAEVLGTSTDAMVLGTSTTCGINLTSFLRIGQKNDTVEVKKLQQFLNEEMKSGLPITGFFGPLTFNAVKTFQLKYKNDILTPWLAHGMENDNVATGYVYKTTQYMINKISCESLNLTTPKLP